MSYEFVACDIIGTTNIKEEYGDNGYIDDTVMVSETSTNKEDPELKDHSNYYNLNQHETTVKDNINKECFFTQLLNNIINENDQIKEETTAIDDMKIVLKKERLNCDRCCEEYEDYCTKCKMLVHILNGNAYSGAKDGLPNGILEIRQSSDSFGVYTLKIIPNGVKFGPFMGLCASEHSWKLKGGKLVVHDDKINNSNWMRYINSTDNTFKGNLLVLQCEGCLYYHSSREIQIGEELLVSFGKEYSLKEYAEQEFNPAIDWEAHDVFSCTFCCLGFSSKMYLSQHKTVCPYKVCENSTDEELIQCPSCTIYLGHKEYLEHHLTYCDGKANRSTVVPLDRPLIGVKGRVATLKEHKRRQQLLHKCELCKYKTSYKSDLKAHVNRHYEVKMYGCEICRRKFKTEEAFRLHVTNVHVKFEEGESEGRPAGYRSEAMFKRRSSTKGRFGSCDQGKRFACSKCDFKTRRRGSIRQHAISKHSEDARYNCSQCKYKANIKSLLRMHVRLKHLDDYDYRCTECEYKTNYKSYLEKHVRRKHVKEKDFTCPECDYETSYKPCLERHIKTKHVSEKEYKCEECQYQSNCRSALMYHMRGRHINEKDYKCTECGFKTNYKSSLEEHTKTKHLREYDYKCAECAYGTGQMLYLKLHIKSKHLKEKDYKCAECAYEAIRKSLLEKHIRVKHRHEKSHKCAECDFETSYKANLAAHVKAKHLKVCNYKCLACDYVTGFKSQLKTHVKAKHCAEKEHKCTECPYETNNRALLKQHVKAKHVNRKEYNCAECPFKTARVSALETHTNVKHLKVKPHKCVECDYKARCPSELARHVKTKHLNEREYKCPGCDYETGYKTHLRTHMMARHPDMNDAGV